MKKKKVRQSFSTPGTPYGCREFVKVSVRYFCGSMAYLVERLQALVVQNAIHHFGERFPESATAQLNMAVLEAVCSQSFQCKFDGGLLTRRIDKFRSSSVTDCHTGFLGTATEVFGECDAVVDFLPRHFIVDEHQTVIGPDATLAVQQGATFFGSFRIAVFLVGTVLGMSG